MHGLIMWNIVACKKQEREEKNPSKSSHVGIQLLKETDEEKTLTLLIFARVISHVGNEFALLQTTRGKLTTPLLSLGKHDCHAKSKAPLQ